MREITLSDLYNVFIDNLLIIILACILGGVLGFVYTQYIITPMYNSSTKIILATPSEYINTTDEYGLDRELTTNDIILNQKLVSTYSEIIKSRTVIESVIKELKLEESYENIVSNISVTIVKDSEVINIKVSNTDPDIAANIANSIITFFTKQVKEIYDIENVNQIDKAIPSYSAINTGTLKNIILFSFLLFIVSYGILLIIEYFKITFKTPDEIENIMGCSVLAIIPDLDGKGVE